ncbi:MAG TPA: hypothetical protein VH763_16530 [Gemmatimonadales bacterium]|jgi:hypothetical protein
MHKLGAGLLVLCLSSGTPVYAQEVQAAVGYARIFGAGGFSFGLGYLQPLHLGSAPLQQRLGATFWYANTDVASLSSGNAARNLVGIGARYEVEATRCCGPVHPLLALPLQILHSSVEDRTVPVQDAIALRLIPEPPSTSSSENRPGSAWGWGAGVELGAEIPLAAQWNLRTTGTAMYQDIYAGSATNGAWLLHVGMTYRFGGGGG